MSLCCWNYWDRYCRISDDDTFTVFPGTFTTLGFNEGNPDDSQYPYYRFCRWYLESSDTSKKMQITFDYLLIENWWDPVVIYNGWYSSLINR